MTGRSPNRNIVQGITLGVSELSNLRSERAAGVSSLAILPIPFALSERKIAIPILPRVLPWAVFSLGFQPVIARNHCCCTVLCAILLLEPRSVFSCNYGCSTVPWTIFLFCFQPAIARNHGCSTVPWTMFLFCFQPAIACNLGCCTVLCVIFLLGFYSAIAARWMASKNRGTLLEWREKYFCFVRIFRCKTSSFDEGIVGRKKEATIFSILYTYFFCWLHLFLYLYHIKRKTT